MVKERREEDGRPLPEDMLLIVLRKKRMKDS
jgi:hypothetical protein